MKTKQLRDFPLVAAVSVKKYWYHIERENVGHRRSLVDLWMSLVISCVLLHYTGNFGIEKVVPKT